MINITYFYIVENIDNNPNKIYIGKTVNPKQRTYKHKSNYGNGILFTVIDEINSLERKYWEPIERYWIEQFKCWGFILMNGNDGGGGPSFQTEETKIRQSKSKKGKPKPNGFGEKPKGYGDKLSNILTGKKRTDETRKKISDHHKGRKLTKEWKQKMAESHFIPVIQYDLKGNFIRRWESATLASKSISIHPNNIYSACKGEQKTAGGFKWEKE